MSTLRNPTKFGPQRSGMTHARWREVRMSWRYVYWHIPRTPKRDAWTYRKWGSIISQAFPHLAAPIIRQCPAIRDTGRCTAKGTVRMPRVRVPGASRSVLL